MTTTKGHFGIKTRYQETLASFSVALPLSNYAECLAHIKVSPDEYDVCNEMTQNLKARGFKVLHTEGAWNHGTESHQVGYLYDLLKITSAVKTPYILVVEDDWTIKSCEGRFIDHIYQAILALENDPNCMQVRLPRYSNEPARIQNLMQKHGLNRWARKTDVGYYLTDDYSANPSFYRTRDLRAAVLMTLKTNLPKHIEHGMAVALKLLSERLNEQLAFLDPEKVRIGHIGTRPGEEDDLNQPLIVT